MRDLDEQIEEDLEEPVEVVVAGPVEEHKITNPIVVNWFKIEIQILEEAAADMLALAGMLRRFVD